MTNHNPNTKLFSKPFPAVRWFVILFLSVVMVLPLGVALTQFATPFITAGGMGTGIGVALHIVGSLVTAAPLFVLLGANAKFSGWRQKSKTARESETAEENRLALAAKERMDYLTLYNRWTIFQIVAGLAYKNVIANARLEYSVKYNLATKDFNAADEEHIILETLTPLVEFKKPDNYGNQEIRFTIPQDGTKEEALINMSENLRSALGLEAVRLQPSQKAERVVPFLLVKTDILAKRIDGIQFCKYNKPRSWSSIPIGLTEQGKIYNLKIGISALTVGETGSGKGAPFALTLLALSDRVKRGLVKFYASDIKKAEFDAVVVKVPIEGTGHPLLTLGEYLRDKDTGEIETNPFTGEPLVDESTRVPVLDENGNIILDPRTRLQHHFAYSYADTDLFVEQAFTAADSADMVTRLDETLKERQQNLAGRSFTPTTDDPLVILLIDEMNSLLKDKEYKEGAIHQSNIQKQGRSSGFMVQAASQRIQKEALGDLRGDFATRIALRLESSLETALMLGESAAARGATPHTITPAGDWNGYATAGIGFAAGEENVPVRFRTAHVTDEHLAALIVEHGGHPRYVGIFDPVAEQMTKAEFLQEPAPPVLPVIE